MNPQLEEKIRQHREKKLVKKNFDETVEEKRKKLRELQADNF